MTTTNTEPARCLRCRRKLTRSQGYGRTCKARIRAAEHVAHLADFKPEQVDKAREAIADGGIVPASRAGVYRSVSGDGTTTYLTHWATCSCKAGQHGRRCYHVAGVRILEAAKVTRRAA